MRCRFCLAPQFDKTGYHELFECQEIQHVPGGVFEKCKGELGVNKPRFFELVRMLQKRLYSKREGIMLRVKLLHFSAVLKHYRSKGVTVSFRPTGDGPRPITPLTTKEMNTWNDMTNKHPRLGKAFVPSNEGFPTHQSREVPQPPPPRAGQKGALEERS